MGRYWDAGRRLGENFVCLPLLLLLLLLLKDRAVTPGCGEWLCSRLEEDSVAKDRAADKVLWEEEDPIKVLDRRVATNDSMIKNA